MLMLVVVLKMGYYVVRKAREELLAERRSSTTERHTECSTDFWQHSFVAKDTQCV